LFFFYVFVSLLCCHLYGEQKIFIRSLNGGSAVELQLNRSCNHYLIVFGSVEQWCAVYIQTTQLTIVDTLNVSLRLKVSYCLQWISLFFVTLSRDMMVVMDLGQIFGSIDSGLRTKFY